MRVRRSTLSHTSALTPAPPHPARQRRRQEDTRRKLEAAGKVLDSAATGIGAAAPSAAAASDYQTSADVEREGRRGGWRMSLTIF